MQFYSLAHHLKTESGHQFQYHLCLQKALHEHGLRCTVYIDRNAKIPYLPENWVYFFRARNRWHGGDFRALLKKTSDGPRRFFLECFSYIELFHLTIAFCLFDKTEDELWLLLRKDFQQLKFKGFLHAKLILLLQWRLRSRLRLFTDSALVQNELSALLRQSIQLVPLPHTEGPILTENSLTPGRLHCYWPGPPRLTKGWNTIQKILQFSLPETIRVELKASQESKLSSSTCTIRELAPTLTHEDYWKELFACDIVLLPYDASIYRCSTSGIFVESIVAGKIPIIKDNTWLAHELRKFSLEELILDWDHPNFWYHLNAVVHNDAMKDKLKKMQANYQQFHNVTNFGQHLLKIASIY